MRLDGGRGHDQCDQFSLARPSIDDFCYSQLYRRKWSCWSWERASMREGALYPCPCLLLSAFSHHLVYLAWVSPTLRGPMGWARRGGLTAASLHAASDGTTRFTAFPQLKSLVHPLC